jgi:branched-chain amino acid transport system ATP-binding protein
MALLELSNVSKSFGGLTAVNNVNFNIEGGGIVSLIGPNGAGKTTLFNIICCFYPPSTGSIIFKGEDITRCKAFQVCRKGISRTFQITKSFHQMNVVENVMIGALFGKQASNNLSNAREESERLIDLFGLAGKAYMPISNLTAIDARRLELIRAIAAKPELILLDEVMAGLNPSEITDAMMLIQKMRTEMGITVLMVEHIMKSVMGISDRILVLSYGKLIAQGSPLEIRRNQEVIDAYLGETESLVI